MIIMKKILILSLIALTTIVLTGCTNKDNSESTSVEGCEDCVYSFYTDRKSYGENGSTLTKYTKDYTTLKDNAGKKRQVFLGHILDENGKIKKAYVCGINNNKVICIDGTRSFDELLSEFTKKYGEGKIYDEEMAWQLDDMVIGLAKVGEETAVFTATKGILEGDCDASDVIVVKNESTNENMISGIEAHCK